jgi:hypothetical protein
LEVKKRMREILSKLKKTFWKLESIYLILFAAFMFGGLSYIPQIREHPNQLWNVIWNCTFGLLFLAYFLNTKNHVLRELVRLWFYIVFAFEMICYVIVFTVHPVGSTSRASYIVTFILCELIIAGGIYFSWKDYKKEKYLVKEHQSELEKKI